MLPSPGEPKGNSKLQKHRMFSYSHSDLLLITVGIYCENIKSYIRCPHNRFLHIKSADYGRTDNKECRDGRNPIDSSEMNPETPCSSKVLSEVRAK